MKAQKSLILFIGVAALTWASLRAVSPPESAAGFNEPPVCDAGPPDIKRCEGATTSFQLDGTGSFDPDNDPLTYNWKSNCPGASFDDPSSPTPILTIDTSQNCDVRCVIRLSVHDGISSSSCTTHIRVVNAVDCCEGDKPVALTFRYTGLDCSATSHSQDPKDVECSGDPAGEPQVRIVAEEKGRGNALWFDGVVSIGDSFTMSAANANKDKFSANTKVSIYDLQDVLLQEIEFHTSCSEPLVRGDQFGALFLVDCGDGSSDDSCCIEGKPKTLTMVYTGQDCSATQHSQETSKVNCSGDPQMASPVRIVASEDKDGGGKVWFDGIVDLNDKFKIDAAMGGEDKLKAETHVTIYDTQNVVLQEIEFHTSCSQPLNRGDQFGALLLRNCEPEGPGGNPNDFCEGGAKAAALKVAYTGRDCSATSHLQDPNKVSCNGDPAAEQFVEVLAFDKKHPSRIWFQGVVKRGKTFFLDAANAGESKLSAETIVQIFDLNNKILQEIEFHTSCSQPLQRGDQFGAIILASFIPE